MGNSKCVVFESRSQSGRTGFRSNGVPGHGNLPRPSNIEIMNAFRIESVPLAIVPFDDEALASDLDHFDRFILGKDYRFPMKLEHVTRLVTLNLFALSHGPPEGGNHRHFPFRVRYEALAFHF